MNTRALVAALLALALVTAAVPPGPAEENADARAWALSIQVPGQPLVEIASADASLGGAPVATARPVAVAGEAALAVRADGDTPHDEDALESWLDPTGSMSLSAGAMEASARPGGAHARVSVAAGAGSGFAMADRLFTWEQQEEVLGTWGEASEALFGLADNSLDLVRPLLAPRNLVIPPLEPLAPLGFVDVAGTEHLAARAEVASSPGFATATAGTDVSRVRLLAGFVELDEVRVAVQSEVVNGIPSTRSVTSIGRIRLAGIEVVASEDGLQVATNDLVAREALQPVLERILEQLDSVGIRLYIARTRDQDGWAQATAFALEVATSGGMASISVGHAENSLVVQPLPAPPATPPVPAAPPPVFDGGAPQDTAATLLPPPPPADTPPVPAPAPVPTLSAPEATAAAVGLRLTPPPAAAARALTLAYVVTAAGALVAAATGLALVGSAVRPSRPRRPRQE